jgi:hypothetical protein
MLHRKDPAGLIVIAQPAHAWISGQLARAWGNAQFGRVEPWEEVCLAAEQHDIGMAAWETAPTFNPATGTAHHFMNLPIGLHLGVFAAATPLALTQSRYAALLTSLHFTGLAERRDNPADTPKDRAAVRDFVARTVAWQESTIADLRAEPRYAAYATPEAIARNRQLVRIWDWFSLVLLLGFDGTTTVPGVPSATGSIDLTLTQSADDPTRIAVSPWPFARDHVSLVCEGRRLPDTYPDQDTMRAALARAPWVTLEFELLKG